jgi:Na+-translocating ferredoxin:NAD+ oxidoreductase RnfG subunit
MRYAPCTCTTLVAALVVSAAFTPITVFGADYMTVVETQKTMFPDATAFEAQAVMLSPEQIKTLAAMAGTPVNPSQWHVFAAKSGETLLGYVMTDAVIGKFMLINYAVAFGTDGTIRDVEILSYREEHGGEVRTTAWRKQFTGKSAAAPLRINDDIQNISGATMSCTHLTDGIRRLAAYAQSVLVKH